MASTGRRLRKDDLDRRQEAISSEIEAKVPFEHLDYVSSIKLANIKLRILTPKFKSLIS